MDTKERENFNRNSTLIVEHTREGLADLIELNSSLAGHSSSYFEAFINAHQHEVYHLCYNRSRCCQCPPGYTLPSTRVLHPSQLELLLDKNGSKKMCHNPGRSADFCCCFAHRGLTTNVLDVTLARCLLVNFCHDVFWYSCLTAQKQTLEDFLTHNKHDIYHLYESNRCCQCPLSYVCPTKKNMLTRKQWNQLFSTRCLSCPLDRTRSGSGTQSICSMSVTPGITVAHLSSDVSQMLIEHCCPLRKSVEKLAHVKDAKISNNEYVKYRSQIELNLILIAKICNKESEVQHKLIDLDRRTLDATLLMQTIKEHLYTVEVMSTQMAEESAEIKEEITTRVKQESANIKEEITTRVKQESADFKEEITARVKQESADIKEEITTRVEQESSNSKKEISTIITQKTTEIKTRMTKESADIKEEIKTRMTQGSAEIREEITKRIAHKSTEIKTQITTRMAQESAEIEDKITTRMAQESAEIKDEITTQMAQDSAEIKDEITTKMTQESAEIKAEITTRIAQESAEIKDEITTKMAQKSAEIKDEITTRIAQESAEIKDEITTKMAQESAEIKRTTKRMVQHIDRRMKDMSTTLSSQVGQGMVKQQIEEKRKKLLENTENSIKTHTNENTFVHTNVVKEALTCVKQNGVVLLIGPPGIGKSRIGLELLRHMKNEGRRSLQLDDISQWQNMSDGMDAVFIDDVLGRTNCSYNDNVHSKLFEIIFTTIQNKNVKVILALRNNIYRTVSPITARHRI